uniref:ABC1 atypical kinase-like domain-containing protein n=1 Tax=Timema douglasi TaxID=61478 RepID=A0A7R8Z934_TIMDO|nr:unnamed protein product [Timema douglasi]
MKMTAVLLTTLFPSLKWLSLEDCVKDFTQMMKAQVDFTIEAHNLDKFSDNFKHISTVKFPRPIWPLTHPFLLVETFEEGHPMQDYVVLKDRQEEIHTKLAEVGINTILKMVFEDNFAHGDLHPGNMLVQDIPDSQVKKTTNKRKWFGKLQGSQSPPFHLVILDCGIVSSLDERGKICLKEVFSAVANKDGARVAQLFLEHSNHQCSDTDSFKQQMIEIVDSAVSKNVTLEQVEVSDLLSTLFSAVINHKVKLDGSFSSVILAIMILEGLGRSLDPTIDIVEKAKPFLFSAM